MTSSPSAYLYLHGFASSPHSTKAQYLRHCFSELQLSLAIPDLNQRDFSHLTLTRQLEQVGAILGASPTAFTLIGSSLGGLTAAWLGEKYRQVQGLILLAPAFGFPASWLTQLGEGQMAQWQAAGYLGVYHYGAKQTLPLHYSFVTDSSQYGGGQLQREIPTLILKLI